MAAGLLPWLLQEDNPPVRFFTLCDLLDRPMSDPEVEQARAAIMEHLPVRSILAHLSAPGYWERAGDEHVRRHIVWVRLLSELGAVPDHPLVRRACEFALETMQCSDGSFPSRHPVYGGVCPLRPGLGDRGSCAAYVQARPSPRTRGRVRRFHAL
jgi:hypothetical protein